MLGRKIQAQSVQKGIQRTFKPQPFLGGLGLGAEHQAGQMTPEQHKGAVICVAALGAAGELQILHVAVVFPEKLGQDVQHHGDGLRLTGEGGMTLVGADEDDVAVPQQMGRAVRADLQLAPHHRQQFQLLVPVVVV